MSRPVVTRFAPSPTGSLHIGGARTALFNALYAKHTGGKMLLRIEDTDRERSTQENVQIVLDGLSWLGVSWDEEPLLQHTRADRHREVAMEMLGKGRAYRCWMSPEELEVERGIARAEGRSVRSPWRDRTDGMISDPHVIRFRAPREGATILADVVKGDISFDNNQLDDLILLRSDGAPTYNLAVVGDDHDMGVTHIIRGDDHLTNAARQTQIYQAMGWDIPVWAHIPLIHGPDGKKLSKRHGATGIDEYQAMGYPAAGMRNYLTRLGWAHGDAEIFTSAEAMQMFDLKGIGRAPARLDFKKLENTCGHHIAMAEDAALLHELQAYLVAAKRPELTQTQHDLLLKGMYCVKDRAKTFPELLEKAQFAMVSRPIVADEASAKALDSVSRGILKSLTPQLRNVSWTKEALEPILNHAAAENGIGFGKLAAPLRAALAGRSATPSVYDMMLVIGQDETIARLEDAAA